MGEREGSTTKLRHSTAAWKWLGLVSAVWVQAVSGNNYTFSNYSDALKALLDLNQLQLNNLSVAKDVGKAFGLLAGFASDYLPTWCILLIGSLEGFLGYGVQWLVVSRRISPLPYWQMCVVMCMGGNSTTWMNTAVLVTVLRNFRRNRGPVSGLLKGYVGLSTAIFTDLSSALFAGSPSYFLLMLTLFPGIVCVVAMIFLREIPTDDADDVTDHSQENESRWFSVVNSLAVVIAVYLLLHDVTGSDHSVAFSRAFCVGLVVLLASPLVIPAHIAVNSRRRKRDDVETTTVREPLLKAEVGEKGKEEAENGEAAEVRAKVVVIGGELTVWEAVRTWEFWILFVSFLCGVGTGLAVMNNLGQIGEALGYEDVSIFVSLTSIFGFFGRIGSGLVSEHFIRKSATPRPAWNAASQVLMAAGYIFMALGLPGSLYVGSIVVGICYGIRIAVSVPTASELFGLKYYGMIYNVLILNLPLGSFLFSGLLAGILYDVEARKNSNLGFNTCIGAHCYRMVFLVMAGACIVGFVLDLVLSLRMKEIYKKIQATKQGRRK